MNPIGIAEDHAQLKKITKLLRQMLESKKQSNMMAEGFYCCIIAMFFPLDVNLSLEVVRLSVSVEDSIVVKVLCVLFALMNKRRQLDKTSLILHGYRTNEKRKIETR